jgi:hypothetical protein
MENHSLCKLVKDIPHGAAHRCWTLRADNRGHYHNTVSLSERPLYLELRWRARAGDSAQPVGVFRLDLDGLLRAHYIRHDPTGSQGSDVRLRVLRANDGSFYVQTNRKGPRLLLPRKTP